MSAKFATRQAYAKIPSRWVEPVTPHASGEPLKAALLLHGLTGSPAEMVPIAEHLSSTGWLSYIPLLPGHGGTLEDLARVSLDTWLEASEAYVEELKALSGASKILVCGLSFGTLLAWWLATRSDQKLQGLILLSPPLRFRSWLSELTLQLLARCPDWLLNSLGSKKKTPRPEGYLELPHNSLDRHSLAAAARTVRLRNHLLGGGQDIRLPTLIGFDPKDHLICASMTRLLMERAFPSAAFLEFPGGEHELPLGHRRQEVLSALEAFVQTLK